jgi:hypothetical protein
MYYITCLCKVGVIKNIKIYTSDWRNTSGIQMRKLFLIQNMHFKFMVGGMGWDFKMKYGQAEAMTKRNYQNQK